MEYNKFKLNNEIKNEIARDIRDAVKEDFKKDFYTEMAIMYNPNSELFTIRNTFDIDQLTYNGYILYKVLTLNKADTKVTIKNFREMVFGK